VNPLTGERLARWLEAQFANFREDLPLWTGLARTLPGLILELGCGTGRILLPLAAQGCQILGVDRETAMLLRLRTRLADTHPPGQVFLLQADARALPLRGRFRLILAPLNVLAHLKDSQLLELFTWASANLAPDGLLAAELPAPGHLAEPLEQGEPIDTFLDPQTGNPVQVSARTELSADGHRLEAMWFYDELMPDGSANRYLLRHRYWVRTPGQLRRLCRMAGLKAVQIFGSYELDPFGPSSPLLLFLAAPQQISDPSAR